ncbi:MAG: hypothetical protein CHACPFDD_03643 [Phycisphaerae bacterium]|nr:hypothetical protein [Phycisphaerae bacterium]
MNRRVWIKARWLVAMSSGLVFASGCDAVMETIRLAFNIVDVWV